MGLLVRDAVAGDADAVAGVHVRSWRAAYAGLLPDGFLAGLDADVRADMWRERLAAPEPGTWVLVAEDGGELLGFAAGGPERDSGASPPRGELYSLYLEPLHWGRGVGCALQNAALEALAGAGFGEAGLWVLDSNAAARRFYGRWGWWVDGRVKVEWRDGVPLPHVGYSRRLP